ncbi:MAG: response regulator [Bacteroidota bacterium]
MKTANILLVEDNEGDILLTREALSERKLVNEISVVKNGQDAIDFVFKRGKFADAFTPDLILLDVNLPKKSGHEVLKELKSNHETKVIPIIMLTTSSNEKDVLQSYQNHANSYITKPIDMEAFIDAIAKIEEFWIQLVKLPKLKK